MSSLSRRSFLGALAPIVAAAGAEEAVPEQPPAPKTPVSRPATAAPGQLPLSRFQPRSMLHVPETKIERARFPVIDFHTHLSWQKVNRGPIPSGEAMTFLAPPVDLLAVMDRKNLKMMVNLTGGVGRGLDQAVRDYDAAHPGRFLTFTEPWWVRTAEKDYPTFQADEIQRAHRAGAQGREGAQDTRPVPSFTNLHRNAHQDRRSALRSDVGDVRRVGDSRSPFTSPIPRPFSCQSIASTSGTRSCTTIRTGRFMGGTFRAIAS